MQQQRPLSCSSAELHTCHVKDDPSALPPSMHVSPGNAALYLSNGALSVTTNSVHSSNGSKRAIMKHPCSSSQTPFSSSGQAAAAADTVKSSQDNVNVGTYANNPPSTLSPNAIAVPSTAGLPMTLNHTNTSPQQRSQFPLSPEANTTYSSSPAHSSYNRSYSLTATEHKTVNEGLAVNRCAPTTRTVPWNSNMQPKESCPREVLPKIDTHKKNRYDYLSVGVSPANSEKQKPKTAAETTPSGSPHSMILQSRRETARGNSSSNSPNAKLTDWDDSQAVQTGVHPATDVPSVESKAAAGSGFKDRILKLLQEIDFGAAVEELQHFDESDPTEKPELLKCWQFFQVVAKEPAYLSVEDIHGLFLIFTPPGVLLQEAVDFLWEECDHHTMLSLENFAQFGARLRERLLEYDTFAQLDDAAKLMSTYARIFPNEPLAQEDREMARLRLAEAATQACSDAKALRVYELLFLADYHDDLYQRGRLSRSEVADVIAAGNFVLGGDLCADLQRYREELRAMALHGSSEAATQTELSGEAAVVPRAVGAQAVDVRAGNDTQTTRECNAATPDGWIDDHEAQDQCERYPLPVAHPDSGGDDATYAASREVAAPKDEVGEAAATRGGGTPSPPRRAKTTHNSPVPANPSSRQRHGSTRRRKPADGKSAEAGALTSRGQKNRMPASSARTTSPYFGDSYSTTRVPHQPRTHVSPYSGRPPFNLERQPAESHVKYLGPSVEEDYAQRVQQDTRLIYLLQANYQ